MLNPQTTSRFEMDYKKALNAGKNMNKLKQVMKWIVSEESLPTKINDHKLIGNYQGRRECHLEGDWLLIYKLESGSVVFERTGTHSELFKK